MCHIPILPNIIALTEARAWAINGGQMLLGTLTQDSHKNPENSGPDNAG